MTAAGAPDRDDVARVARAAGANIFGVAAVPGGAPPPFTGYPRAIVAGVVLARGVLATCVHEPTRLYAYHYRVVNAALDNIAVRVAAFLEERGCAAFAVPASQIDDWENVVGGVSHVRLAELAGLGFRGRHNMLVTRDFGAGVRLVSVFTDAPLAPDHAIADACGMCDACRAACPAGAVGAATADWSRTRCLDALRDFKKRITGQYICGVCVRVCTLAARGRPTA